MKYNELQAIPNKNRKRSGRGIAAGRGKTAGRGTKGQSSRSGGKRAPGFEGGQTPLIQRIPKVRGFKSLAPKIATITTDQLEALKAKDVVDIKYLKSNKIVASKFADFKVVLGKNPVKGKINVVARGISASAKEQIEKAGGSYAKSSPSKDNLKNTEKR